MTEQPRVPKGVSTGGQFSASERGEPGVSLRPLDGSFLYPPPLHTAEDIIDFWSRVEIPDEALARTQRVYRENFDMVTESWAHHAWDWHAERRWNADNPYPASGDPGEIADWEGRQRAAQADYEEGLAKRLATRPRDLPRADIRPTFRAAAMMRAASDLNLPREEFLKVSEHPVEFSDGPRPAGDAAVESGLVGLSNRFVDPENYDSDGDGRIDAPAQMPSVGMDANFDWTRHKKIVDESVRAALAEQGKKLDDVFDEMFDNMNRMANLTVDMHDPKYGKRRR